MGEKQTTMDALLQQVPVKESSWPDELTADLDTFRDAQKSEGGLIPNAACHTIFGVSRQRWDAMCGEYQFKCWTLFGKKWFSRQQLEKFEKINRAELGGHHTSKGSKLARILKDCLADASKD